MLLYLAALFIFYLINNIFQISQFFVGGQHTAEYYFNGGGISVYESAETLINQFFT